jgi:outer membrane protein assembly factor BamB
VAAAAVAIVLILVGSIYIVGPQLLKSPQSAETSSSNGPTTSVSLSASVSTSSHGVVATSSTSSTTSSTSSTTSGAALGEDWTTYHGDNARTGYQQVSNFTSVTSDWTSPNLDGAIYAEPLVYGGDVFVATENNSVYALSAQNGSIVWRTNLGPPVAANQLQCGDINPSGITGTPVIDPSTGTLFVVSFSAESLSHVLSAINVSTGAVVFQRQADPPGFVVTAQQERSALSLANGMVYILYGGLAGDCGQYYGWVVGLAANGTGGMAVYQVPTTREGGLWAPSGAAVDPSGNVYVATGNGASITTFDHGDSVIKLSPALSEEGYFAPTNWSVLNQADADLGSVGPAIIGPNVLFQVGKEGVGYLLDGSKLGGVGGQTFSASVCGESFGGTAYSSPYLFVPCTDGLVELQIANGAFTTKWHTQSFNAGPPIVTGGVVWTVDTSSATLLGYSVSTGNQAYSFPLGSVVHFCSLAAGDGRVFVAAGSGVSSFLLG